jgi:hypothetical protein
MVGWQPMASVSYLATCVEGTEPCVRVGYCPQIWVRQFGGVTRLGRGLGADGAVGEVLAGLRAVDDEGVSVLDHAIVSVGPIRTT